MAAHIASAMPVLPLVGSIRVSPGLMSPRSWARRIIENAGRSLTEPAGLLPSSLTSSVLLLKPGSRFSRTSGVLPTKSSSVWKAGRERVSMLIMITDALSASCRITLSRQDIWRAHLARSGAGFLQELLDVARYALLHREEWLVVARGAQIGDVR